MNEIKLSIIVPVYNAEKYLKRCLNSLVVSVGDRKEVEVIIVDDGSSDDSYDICKNYPEFICKYSYSNWGVSVTRNTGLTLAQGEYVTFLDADDEMLLDGISIILEAIQKNPTYNIIQFNHDRYYAKINKRVIKYTLTSGKYNWLKFLYKIPMWRMVWNKVYKRNFLIDNNIRFKFGVQFGEDELFNLLCLQHESQLLHVGQSTMVKHFENENSLAHSVVPEQLIEQNQILCDLLMHSDSKEFRNMVRSVIANHWNSKLYQKTFG